MKEEDMDWGENEGEIIEKADNVVNILLIGQDAREGEGRSRSDSMILVTFNKDTKTITMTSFLRDMYVKIPGYQDNKLNATYVFGGMPLLNQTLEQNFGVQVDGNVEVDFSHFAEVIDLLGGVDLELRYDEAATINNATGRLVLGTGMMHLDGEQALVYSRIRSLDADADFSRTNRQRKVINALIEKFRNTKLTTLLGLVDDLLPMITTDMSNGEIIELAYELFPMLADCTIVSQRVPADGAYELKTVRDMSCIVAEMDAARQLLKETLGG
jgi:LCP family protein required for cell wall assembly